VLSQYVEVSYADDLLADRSGAVGYLLKDRVAQVSDFLDAVRRVAAGGTVLDPEVVAQLMARRSSDPMDQLTPREHEVLRLMAEGRSNAGIARALKVSHSATEKYISNIFAKPGRPLVARQPNPVSGMLRHRRFAVRDTCPFTADVPVPAAGGHRG